jgi:hypothetical protein
MPSHHYRPALAGGFFIFQDPQMTKHDHVVARFNGADLTFRIARADLDTLEAFGTPAFRMFRNISASSWTVADLKFVLAFALAPAGRWTKLAGAAANAGPEVAKVLGQASISDPRVEAAFAKNPPADYVALAQAVLAAALLGIDQTDAVFSDEPVDA